MLCNVSRFTPVRSRELVTLKWSRKTTPGRPRPGIACIVDPVGLLTLEARVRPGGNAGQSFCTGLEMVKVGGTRGSGSHVLDVSKRLVAGTKSFSPAGVLNLDLLNVLYAHRMSCYHLVELR